MDHRRHGGGDESIPAGARVRAQGERRAVGDGGDIARDAGTRNRLADDIAGGRSDLDGSRGVGRLHQTRGRKQDARDGDRLGTATHQDGAGGKGKRRVGRAADRQGAGVRDRQSAQIATRGQVIRRISRRHLQHVVRAGSVDIGDGGIGAEGLEAICGDIGREVGANRDARRQAVGDTGDLDLIRHAQIGDTDEVQGAAGVSVESGVQRGEGQRVATGAGESDGGRTAGLERTGGFRRRVADQAQRTAHQVDGSGVRQSVVIIGRVIQRQHAARVDGQGRRRTRPGAVGAR